MKKLFFTLFAVLFFVGTVYAASEIRVKYRDEQAVIPMTTATTADTSSGGGSWIDNIDGANYLGAQCFDVYLGIESGPSGGASTVSVYMETSLNENTEISGNSDFCLSVAIDNGEVGEFYCGRLYGAPGYFRLYYVPADYNITGGVTVVPVLDEAQ